MTIKDFYRRLFLETKKVQVMKQLCKARKIIVAAIAFIVLAISVFAYNKVFRANVSTSSEPAEEKTATVPVVSRQSNLAESKIKNADTVAWLYLPGTEIDEAVVQAKDNEYYLQRTFDKKYDIWGCYFADYINDLSGRDKLSPNTIIYGHAYRNEDPNERKFTQLFKYLDAAFIEQNPYIYLAVDGEDLVFQVCAVFLRIFHLITLILRLEPNFMPLSLRRTSLFLKGSVLVRRQGVDAFYLLTSLRYEKHSEPSLCGHRKTVAARCGSATHGNRDKSESATTLGRTKKLKRSIKNGRGYVRFFVCCFNMKI